MCVLLCGVWSLKKASLKCDKLCWWPLNLNTLHNYTCIKVDKFILPKSEEISHHPKVPAQQAWTWAGLRPIRTTGFDKPPVGRGKSDCWKTTCESQIALLALDSRGSWLEHLLNIFWAELVTLLVLLRSLPARAITRTLTSKPTKPTI